MKILSIEFEKHPILGNLKLDFADKNGNPVDTVILAGENGCGKTTILEEIRNLWDTAKHNTSYKGKYITAKVYIDKKEINQMLQKISETNHNDIMPQNPTGVFVIKSDLSTGAWGCFDIKYQQIETEDFVSANCFLMAYLQPFSQSIFSPVDINYHSQNITSIQATSLDSDGSGRKKSNENLATEINQLLVDAEASDASEVLAWVRAHPTQTMPQHLVSPRIKRFSTAFSKMFDDIEFSRVDNVQSIKTIFFKRKNTEIPISQLSSGEKQIVYRGAYLLKDIRLDLGKAVLIDEPEISLHPEWQKKILGYYQSLFSDETGKQLSQMFIATHSPFIIHNPNRHNDKVVVLKKDDNGNIFQSDKPEYYDCNSCKAVEDSFSVYDFNDDKQETIFVEDSAHENIVRKLLAEYHSDIAVSKLGSCDKVLSTSKGVKESFDNFYFLIDGDCKTYNDADLWHNNTLQLKKYCIENYLLTKEAITHLLTLKREKISAEEFIKDVIDECKSGYSGFTVLKDSIDKYGLDWSAIDNVDASKIFEKIKNKLGYKSAIDVENVCFDALKNPNKLGTVFQEIIVFLGLKDAE